MQLLRKAIKMRDSGALSDEEFDSLTAMLLEGRPVPGSTDGATPSPKRGR